MRVIEKEMIRAIAGGNCWSKDNTTVTHADGVTDVYLHGNHIASAARNYYGSIEIVPNSATLLQWPTRTTMSRLRALGVDVCTRKGVVHLNGKPLEG